MQLFLVLLGAFVGGFVSGLTGFGTGLTALGIWLQAISPALASPLVVICSVISQGQTFPRIWHAIDARRLWPFVVGGLLGVPLSTLLLAHVEPRVFSFLIRNSI